ncbi:hypothetical protein ACFXKJ_28690 [Kitasatospora indigofera]|uniref:hypothetical protein n=1 Tax=Kitasatospora indigofera TaxID=67307 RepID=UPI0036AEFD5B
MGLGDAGGSHSTRGAGDPLDGYLECARKAYGSLEDPNFLFSSEAIERRPYDGLIDSISKICEVIDRTALGVDVCFNLELTVPKRRWRLLLSMVGPYSMLLGVTPFSAPRFRSSTVSVVENPELEVEQNIFDLVRSAGFMMLNSVEAEAPVRFSPPPEFEPEEVPLFRVLFSDAEVMPWQKI